MLAFLPSLALLALTGCAPLDFHKMRFPWQDKPDDFQSPERVVAFWTDTVLHQPNQPAIRGFGGRVFFYGDADSKPIEVDGTLSIYAFDAEQVDPDRQRPEKKFVFPADQLQAHLSQAALGPSYSVWLPWDGVLGPKRNISLVVRFEGREGGIVISEPINKLLPGTGTQDSMRVQRGERKGSDAIQLVGHEQTSADGSAVAIPESVPASGSPLRSESIDLPPSFLRRLERDTEPTATSTNAPWPASVPERGTPDSPSSTLPSGSADGAAPTTNPPSPAGPGSPPARSGSPTHPVRTTTGFRPPRGPLRRGPLLAESLSALPSTPRYGWGPPAAETGPTYRGPGALKDQQPLPLVPQN